MKISRGSAPDAPLDAKLRTSGARVMRRAIWVSVVGGLAAVVLVSLGVFFVLSDRVIHEAEDLATRLGMAIVVSHADDLLSEEAGGRLVLDVTKDDAVRLDAQLDQIVEPFDIVKIKVYDTEARIVYSTDAKIIGIIDQENERLGRALAGTVDSKLESKDEVIDLQEETRFDRDVVETYVPIFDRQGQVVGSFEVYQDITGTIRELRAVVAYITVMILVVISILVALSLYVLRGATRRFDIRERQLLAQSSTDNLTGLSSRGAIYERAVEECSRMARLAERPLVGALGVIFADVDRLTLVNDEYGHEAGDEVLREVARRLGTCVRSYDLAGRYGGEEFLMLLPETSLATAASVAERLRASVSSTSVTTSKGEIPVTMSIGVAAANCGAIDVDGALRLAEEALLLAKARGCNAVVVMPPLPGPAA